VLVGELDVETLVGLAAAADTAPGVQHGAHANAPQTVRIIAMFPPADISCFQLSHALEAIIRRLLPAMTASRGCRSSRFCAADR
jgi:hypothetical protein